MVYVSLFLHTDDPEHQKELLQMMNQKHPLLNLLIAHGMTVDGMENNGEIVIIDLKYPDTKEAPAAKELLKDTQVTHLPDERVSHPAVEDNTSEEPRETRDRHLNVSAHTLLDRRLKLRGVLECISDSQTGLFADIWDLYRSRRRNYNYKNFSMWMGEFERRGWIGFTDRWRVVRKSLTRISIKWQTTTIETGTTVTNG